MRERAPAGVIWRDLAYLSAGEKLRELLLPLPWLLLALAAGHAGIYLVTVLATWFVFMTGLRITHNAFHRSLGLSARANDWVMFTVSVLLGGAMHAIEHTHLHHHRHCLADDDIEGRISRLRFWPALLSSPMYPVHIHATAMRKGSARQRRWIIRELAGAAALHACIWLLWDIETLRWMSLALIFANASVPMIGIWSVHQGCADHGFIARSSRVRWLNQLSGGMLFHLEHHLYPGVPTRHLHVLAKRFDAARTASLGAVYGGNV